MVKAVFFDIDGTLVPFGSPGIPSSTLYALDALRSKGVKIFISTGRHINWVNNIGETEFDGYITVNGALCLSSDKSSVIYKRTIAPEDIARVAEYSHHTSLPFVVIPAEGDIYATAKDENYHEVARLLRAPETPVRSLDEAIGREIVQMMVFGSPEQIKSSRLFEDIMPGCEPTSWCQYFADIIPAGSDKSIGIDRMIEYFGIDLSETMAFGDGENDMGMLRHVAIGIAMGNASAHVKSAADYITSEASDNGVADALHHFGLIG